jgi:hypothetical protein
MVKVLSAAILIALMQSALPGTPFRPWGEIGYRTINAIEFSPDGQSMFVALETARVAKIEGREPAVNAPEIALYESRRDGDGWSRPQLLSFAGTHKDYEAALSPDGRWMLFNSWRPLPDGRTVDKNNLWLTRRTPGGWSQPIYLSAINRPESEDSYAAIGPDGLVVFLSEGSSDAHGIDYNLYQTRITGDDASAPLPFAPAATTAGEGDPWFARDGSYVIFTRWDRARQWETDADLFITFRRGNGWTAATPLTEMNDPAGPDYAVSISGSPERIYWKRRNGTFSTEWAPLLAAARARAAEPTMQWLASLAGTWNTEDTYHPADGSKPIVERAVRTCQLVMHGSYMQCESVVTRPDGTGRTYRFLINYNRTTKQFEMLSIWSNVPHKLVQALTPDAGRRRWSIANVAVVGDDEPLSNHWSELVFESDDRIVWTGRRVSPGGNPSTSPLAFVESWVRVK